MQLLRQSLAEAHVHAFLITHRPNVFYLSGFSGSAGALVVEAGKATLFTDSRYALQAHQEVREARTRIVRGPLLAAAGQVLKRFPRARVAFEPAWLSVAQKAELSRAAGGRIRWVGLSNQVEELRAIKGQDEIAQIRRAARLASAIFEEILPMVKPGVREMELAAEIEYRMRRQGASGPAFPTIVASGRRSALPHARPTGKKLRKNELVVLDLGAILREYCCDLTRTVYVGRRAPAEIRRWYEAVREAQAAACEALCAGVAAGDVDAAARHVLRRFGLERYFVHTTGHGLGLEVHEVPRLAGAQRRVIQAGNVVTIEPGVYVQGVGGIRIEDDVAVSANRTEVLSTATREFLEL